MQKGKLGIMLNTYAVLAFIFALFAQLQLLLLLMAFVLLVEKDDWTSRQVFQALLIPVFNLLVTAAIGVLAWTIIVPIAGAIFLIVIYICTIISLVRVSKKQEANMLILGKYADRAFCRVAVPPPTYNPGYPAPGGYPGAQPPPYQGGYAPPPPPQDMNQQPPPPPQGM